jgi:hypothetical protein
VADHPESPSEKEFPQQYVATLFSPHRNMLRPKWPKIDFSDRLQNKRNFGIIVSVFFSQGSTAARDMKHMMGK